MKIFEKLGKAKPLKGIGGYVYENGPTYQSDSNYDHNLGPIRWKILPNVANFFELLRKIVKKQWKLWSRFSWKRPDRF